MSALLPASRRAQKFAALVDAGDAGAGAGDSYATLLEVVGVLRSAADAAPAPRADYVSDLRARLMAEAATALVPTDSRLVLPQRHAPRRQSRLSAAAAGLVLVGSSAGIAVAAQTSVPGDGLYPVKRGLEQVGEALSFSDASRGRDLLGQASSRLDEVDTLLASGAPDARVASTLHSFTTTAGDGADLLFQTYQRDGNDASVSSVRDFAGTEMGTLTDLARQAPPSLRPDFAAAAQLLTDIDQQARVLCSDCGARSTLQLPSDLRLSSSETALTTLLGVPTPTVPGAGGTSPATGAGDATDTATGTAGVPDTQTAGTVSLPSLEDLLGTQGSTSTAGTGSGTGTSASTPSNPLGSILPSPSIPTSLPTSLPGVGDVTNKVQKQVGSLTDPLLP
ncbi:MAG: hypothetical protein QOH37_3870 [Nocardioidaceae bacterium]|nr:hypothetical protein [Nocardioidaceae bacterium]